MNDGRSKGIQARARTLWFGLRDAARRPVSADGSGAANTTRAGGLSLRSKLLVMLLATSLVSTGLVTLIGLRNGTSTLRREVESRLTSLKSAKKGQVERYFRNLSATFGAFGNDIAMVSSLALLRDGFVALGSDGDAKERREKLARYYSESVVAWLKERHVEDVRADALVPRTDRGQELQALFILDNPQTARRRSALKDHPRSNPYTAAHSIYHDWLRDIAERYELRDLYLIDTDGTILYSVQKQIDLGTSLVNGPHAETAFGRLVAEMIRSPSHGTTRYADMSFYRPAGGAPSMFIATPIYAKWKFVGLLAGQISITDLNNMMTNHRNWQSEGFGETGEIYLVGRDRLMRSDSRFLIEAPERFLGEASRNGVPQSVVERIRANKSSVLLQKVDNDVVSAAFDGTSATRVVRDYRGVPVLSSFTKLNLPDLQWAMLAEIDEAEAYAPQATFGRNAMIAACLLALVLTALAFWLADLFLKPVKALIAGIDDLRRTRTFAPVARLSNDEFGQLSDAFNGLAKGIIERETEIRTKNESYEVLLKQIFPDVVADRLRRGEDYKVETAHNVTVIYISLDGLAEVSAAAEGALSYRLLNEAVDLIDTIADETGIEKVKTIGEHYLAVCGLGIPRLDHARRAHAFALAVAKAIREHGDMQERRLSVRVALASGVVHAGLVGTRRFVYDIWGTAFNEARRLSVENGPDEMHVGEATFELIGRPAGFTGPRSIDNPGRAPIIAHVAALGAGNTAATASPTAPATALVQAAGVRTGRS
ncbi:MAG: adenylate/guanylate cyclase domain-containing protein [Hyphomicrobiaceae bacterium]